MQVSDLSYEQLRARLVDECRSRKWRPPSRARLKKLRDSEQLPPAVAHYTKGRRGCEWRYPLATVDGYIRAEELRRASGKRVQSWKLTTRREKTAKVRAWLSNLDGPVPRDAIGDALSDFASLFRQIAPAVYPYVERPVTPADEDRMEDAHTAVESTLEGWALSDEWRPVVEALLQVLIFRDEAGNAENIELAELLEPIRQRAGPFARFGTTNEICNIVREIPLNGLLTHPSDLLAQVSDEEFRSCARIITGLFGVIERVANVAKAVTRVVEKARSDERTSGDVRLDWFKPITEGTISMTKLLNSDFAAAIVCASALTHVWLARQNPGLQGGAATVMASIGGFASLVESSDIAKQQNALKS